MTLIFCLVILAQPEYETNPLKIMMKTGLELYQKIVSSSQGDVCNFSPSCSHFAKQALHRYGPLWGSLMAADRLMRCNPWAFQHFGTYYRRIKNNKLYDPIEQNYIFDRSRKLPYRVRYRLRIIQ